MPTPNPLTASELGLLNSGQFAGRNFAIKMLPQTIPLRKFGRANTQVSVLGFGGHHLGEAPDEKTAVEMVHQAVDGGITFFDNCWEYRRGKTEISGWAQA